MREIIFRGKRLDNGEWVYGGYDPMQGNHTIFDHESITHSAYEVDPSTMGQCTEKPDKNKKLIYESDIIAARFKSNHARQKFICKYNSNNARFEFDNGHVSVGADDIYNIKIIGNIHDNPELPKIKGDAV